jgi:hypothetical protein
MSAGNPSYEGTQQSDTPLPAVAARAARRALAGAAAARRRSAAAQAPATSLTLAQSLARLGLTAAIMAGLMAVFAALVLPALH